LRPRLFAVVELVKKAEVGLEPDAVRLDDGHVVAVMVTLRRVFLAPVHVRLEVHVQVAQALKLAVGPPIDAEVAAPEEGAKRGRGSVRRACLLVSKNGKKWSKSMLEPGKPADVCGDDRAHSLGLEAGGSHVEDLGRGGLGEHRNLRQRVLRHTLSKERVMPGQ